MGAEFWAVFYANLFFFVLISNIIFAKVAGKYNKYYLNRSSIALSLTFSFFLSLYVTGTICYVVSLPAVNRWPIKLEDGRRYELIYSVPSIHNSHQEAKDRYYLVWLRWVDANQKERTVILKLQDLPPKNFLYQQGKFLPVEGGVSLCK